MRPVAPLTMIPIPRSAMAVSLELGLRSGGRPTGRGCSSAGRLSRVRWRISTVTAFRHRQVNHKLEHCSNEPICRRRSSPMPPAPPAPPRGGEEGLSARRRGLGSGVVDHDRHDEGLTAVDAAQGAADRFHDEVLDLADVVYLVLFGACERLGDLEVRADESAGCLEVALGGGFL